MPTDYKRPDPDELLARINSEEEHDKHGKLKIFLGYVAGVGKTYAMLEAAHQRHEEGVDVVIGYAETHGRKETEALVTGLELIPRRQIDYRGTVLSRMLATRTINGQTLFQGAIVSCYNCHNGPQGDDGGPAPAAPTAANVVTNTTNDKSVDMLLTVGGAGAYPRIITQATNGAVGINTNTHVATYFPNPGFVGTDLFTFAAYDSARNSTLVTGTITVAQGPFSIGAAAHVPPTYPAAWPVAFVVVPTVTNNAAPVTFDWNFGDGSVHSTNQYAAQDANFTNALQLVVPFYDYFDYPPHSGSGVITNDPDDPITVTFSKAMYGVSFWYAAPDGIVVTGSNGAVVNGAGVDGTNAQIFVPGEVTSITISANDGADSVTVDDLKYTVAPEPGSFLLVGTGLLGLAASLRRKLGC